MSNPTHTIRLRGPWLVKVSDDLGNQQIERRVNMRQPTDWWSWLRDLEMDISSWKEFVFCRSFNWPQPQPAPACVKLVIEGQAGTPAEVILNQQALVHAAVMPDQSMPDQHWPDKNGLTSCWGTPEASELIELLRSSNDLQIGFTISGDVTGSSNQWFSEWSTSVELRIDDNPRSSQLAN